MSGTVGGAGEILAGPGSEEPPQGAVLPAPSEDEGTWSAERALRKFSQLAFSYGISAALASVSGFLMGVYGTSDSFVVFLAVLPFLLSVVISGSVVADLLEMLWDGLAGRLPASEGSRGWPWSATLVLLLLGMVFFAAGIGLTLLAFGGWPDYTYVVPVAVVALVGCGVFVLTALVVPAAVLGPSKGRWVAALAWLVGVSAVVLEGVVGMNPPFGMDPLFGWMEGTFPLLNWNLGLGGLVAASAFLVWQSYRALLPAERRAGVPAA